MIRLLGFVIGAALAIAAILLVLGVPELASQPDVETAPQPEPEVLIAHAPEPQPEPVQAEPEEAIEPRWHSFWSPFGSQIAANGFVSRLEAVTGYDYRVIKVDTGVYEVTFAYTSDDERREKLAAIAAATGLEMPDS
jgi:hypothetical protein